MLLSSSTRILLCRAEPESRVLSGAADAFKTPTWQLEPSMKSSAPGGDVGVLPDLALQGCREVVHRLPRKGAPLPVPRQLQQGVQQGAHHRGCHRPADHLPGGGQS